MSEGNQRVTLARLEANQEHILDAVRQVREAVQRNTESITPIKVALASSATWTAGHEQQHVSENKDIKRWLGLGSTLSAIIGGIIGVFADR